MASSSCLGLYIEENIIKYAKVSKDHDRIKVEAFGVKFYDRVEEAISQVIQETYSQKTPISVNLSDEMYNYFDMFALLTKNDLQKVIKTEFEAYCAEKGYNPNVFESRYAVTTDEEDKEKIKIIHVAANKIDLNKTIQQVEGYRVTNISPISMTIPNLIDTDRKEDCVVVNIENSTTITTILNNQIYHIDKVEAGSQEFLNRINSKENSYSKAYDICKNTTIYTSEGRNLQIQESGYLEEIMPTLYNVIERVRQVINEYGDKIKRVYISGTAALINNVDLYFQEALTNVRCEILRPYFLEAVGDINIKDYIEVNSAISLGAMGVGEGVTGINFKKKTLSEGVPDWLKIDIGNSDKSPSERKYIGGWFTWDLGQKLDKTEKSLIRISVGLLLLVIMYSTFSALLGSQIKKKKDEANESISSTNSQIALVNADNEKINSKTNEYTTMLKNLEDANNKISERNRTRNAIPNLLNQIMSIVPENVQLTSIENTSDTHIVIQAQSNRYEQLGYLKAKIKTDVILTNVISTAGQKDNNVVTVKIEGELP